MITRYALIAALVAVIGLGGYVMWLRADNEALAAENASLTRSVAALERSRDQARLARDVAEASAQRARERADEYDRLREGLLRGDEDADLPDWFRRYLDDLLGGVRGAP